MLKTFYVDKTNQTYSDILTAIGLAWLINELMDTQGAIDRDVHIEGKEGCYCLTAYPGVDLNNLEFLIESPICPVKAIPTDFYRDKMPLNIPQVNWNSVDEFLNAAKHDVDELLTRPENLDVLLTINPEAIQGYNGLIFKWWEVRSEQPHVMRIILDMYSKHPSSERLEIAAAQWEETNKSHGWKVNTYITGQQLYNPDQGMGQNETKANKLKSSGKPCINFWLVEWLRTLGFFEVAVPRLVGGAKVKPSERDRKILVISPRNFTFVALNEVMSRFENTLTPEVLSPIRFDIFALIRYLKTLLAYLAEPEHKDELEEVGNIKSRIVSGFYVAYYKNMGKARSLMNLSFMGVPGWIIVHSENDIRYFQNLLDELDGHLFRLNEEHSDVVLLIQYFRDFISGDDLNAFLKFTTEYASHYMRKSEKTPLIRSLSPPLVKRIVTTMGKNYAGIADKTLHPGFHNIARAISESTIIAQWRKTKNNQTYQIRYGLHQELARQSQTPEKFLTVLSEFIQQYNSETSRTQELGRKPWRPLIEATDITDILRLMDEYMDSRMIAQLLIAFGSTFMLTDSEQDNQENK